MKDYSEIFEIDPNALDTEWLRQSNLFFSVAQDAADARQEVDECKNNLELTRAELDKKIRTNPAKFGIEKVTEGAITNTILQLKDYKEALECLTVAKHDYDIASAAVSALDHKKRALENLVHLHGQNYYSEPRAKEGTSRETMDAIKSKSVAEKTRPKGKKVKSHRKRRTVKE